MNRRDFLASFSCAAAWPLAAAGIARAQPPGRLPTVGYLGASTPIAQGDWVAAFVNRLHELGWVEGRTVAIVSRWAENRPERYAEIAAEFVNLKVDVIVTLGVAVPAVKRVTSVIPVVFAVDADPVGGGLVASLARPGGNVTGLSSQSPDTASKRLDLAREIIPDLRHIAVMANIKWRGARPEIAEYETAARAAGLEIVEKLEIAKPEDIAIALDALRGRAQALFVSSDPLIAANRARIIAPALAARLPTVFVRRDYVAAGGLMSYGASFTDLNRRAGDYADRILRGARPADLPVEQPIRFDLVVNLKTAKALGLKIPEAFLLRADEVIE